MRAVSDRFIAAINTSHKRLKEVSVTLPGEMTSTVLDIDAGSFNINSDGARYTATVTLSPKLGADIYGLVATPGATFTIRSGVQYGAADTEWVDCGIYEATSGNSLLTIGEIPLGLTDGTARLERCRFTAPWTAAAGTAADAIEAIVLDASPDVEVVQVSTGDDIQATTFDRDRLDALNQLASAGNVVVGFNAVGQYVISDAPVITPTAPVWTAKTGPASNILDASRDMPFGRLYNTVIVVPVDDTQAFSPITVSLMDPTHPRYYLKIGVVPFYYSSPLLVTVDQAKAAGRTILQQLLGTTTHVQATVLGNPALEFGDTLAVIHAQTETDPGLAGTFLLEQMDFDLATGAQDFTSRSTSLAELQES